VGHKLFNPIVYFLPSDMISSDLFTCPVQKDIQPGKLIKLSLKHESHPSNNCGQDYVPNHEFHRLTLPSSTSLPNPAIWVFGSLGVHFHLPRGSSAKGLAPFGPSRTWPILCHCGLELAAGVRAAVGGNAFAGHACTGLC
jgi:hypothetical protein